MSVSLEWQNKKYTEIFEQETRGLKRRMESPCGCTAEELQSVLNNLYIMDGADQGGRGALQDTILAATIAAYERFISEMKKNPLILP